MSDALVEVIAQAMWDARYHKYKWDDVAGDDAYGRKAKKDGFRNTARAALQGLEDAGYEVSYRNAPLRLSQDPERMAKFRQKVDAFIEEWDAQ